MLRPSLLLLTLVLPVAAEDAATDLAAHIPPGQWEFTYQRNGSLKILPYKHHEEGMSKTCIGDDPRRHLLDWIGRKGCSIDREALTEDSYVLGGACRLKWLPGDAVPVDVRLRFGDGRQFVIDLQTRDNPSLSYSEHTLAQYLGDCPPP